VSSKSSRGKLAEGPPIKEALERWAHWTKLGGVRYQRFIPCGQNVRFDIDMINSACRREGVDFQIRAQPLELIAFSMLYFALPDTGTVANYKLETVSECLGISTKGAHTALADVRMTAECMRTYFKKFT